MEELTRAVKSFKSDKCPGNDGLSAEFYQFFWSKLKSIYHSAILYAKQKGILHLAARRGIIALIPKKDKDPLFLKNWRPLTMLNTDYKILVRVLAMRMQSVFGDVIAETQTGFMTGRQASTAIRMAIDITQYNKKINGY